MITNHRPKMSDQDKKLLWGKAGNRCAICRKLLVNVEDEDERGVIVGIEAHIVGHSKDGPRGKNPLPQLERHKYENIILLCTEHAKTIDERQDVWTKERLLQIKRDHEKLMREIKPSIEQPHPILRLIQPVGYSGGPNGHFQTLRIKNFDKETALDLNCWMQGFGFNHQLSRQTSGSFLEPNDIKDFEFRLDDLKIAIEEVPLLYLYVSYSNLEGKKILFKASLVQKTVKSGALKIIGIGDKHEFSKFIKTYVDYMRVLESRGDYVEAEYTIRTDVDNKFRIKVSRTLLSCWDINREDMIQYCFLELGRANMKIMTSLGVFQDKEYATTSFPETISTGFDRFVETLKYIESGNY